MLQQKPITDTFKFCEGMLILSSCSKELRIELSNNIFWVQLYNNVANSAKSSYQYDDRMKYSRSKNEHIQRETFRGESCILPCFLNLDPTISYGHGNWMQACQMLLTRQCFFCKAIAGLANPLCLSRVCVECSTKRPEMRAVAREEAEAIFSSCVAEMQDLPSVNTANQGYVDIELQLEHAQLMKQKLQIQMMMQCVEKCSQFRRKVEHVTRVNTVLVDYDTTLLSLEHLRETVLGKWLREDAATGTVLPAGQYKDRFEKHARLLTQHVAYHAFPIGFVCEGWGSDGNSRCVSMQYPLSLGMCDSMDAAEPDPGSRIIGPYQLLENHAEMNFGTLEYKLAGADMIVRPARQVLLPTGIRNAAAHAELVGLLSSVTQLPARPTGICHRDGNSHK
jgi:hypothetical protein